VVEIDTGDCTDPAIIGSARAENSGVATDIGSDPVEGDVVGIREDGLLPSLKSYVSTSESWVLEDERRIYGHVLSTVAELVAVVEKLSALDEADFVVGERSIG